MEAQPPTSSAQRLPLELYREVLKHLAPGQDVDTLLALCKVSPALRVEGQRILFSMGPDPIYEHRWSSLSQEVQFAIQWSAEPFSRMNDCFTGFLESLLGQNETLAGYVKKYQHISALHGQDQEWYSNLTKMFMDALPLMKNLKWLRLHVCSLQDSQMAALSNITSFQLHALAITPPDASSQLLLSRFLCSQPAMRHLNIMYGEVRNETNLHAFHGILPNLISLKTHNVKLWETMALRNDIKAVHLVGCEALYDEHVAALRKLKYLRFGQGVMPVIYGMSKLESNILRIPAGIDLDITVLRMHMQGDIHKTVYNLTPNLGQLRILIAWEECLWRMSRADPLLFFRRVAAIAFLRCKNLLYVIVPKNKTHKAAYLYQRSPQTAAGEGPVLEEYEFDWDVYADSGAEWWVEWEDILSGASMLDLPSRIHATIVDMSGNYSSDGLYRSK